MKIGITHHINILRKQEVLKRRRKLEVLPLVLKERRRTGLKP